MFQNQISLDSVFIHLNINPKLSFPNQKCLLKIFLIKLQNDLYTILLDMIASQINKLRNIVEFLQTQLQKQRTILNHHSEQYLNLQKLKMQIKNTNKNSSPSKLSPQSQWHSNHSIVSINVQQSPNINKEECQLEQKKADCSIQFGILSKQIRKIINSLSSKQDFTNKSTVLLTPNRKNSMKLNLNGSGIHKSIPRASTIKQKQGSPEINSNQRQQLLGSFGDMSWMIAQDEIVCNLIRNLQKQEEKYVDLVLNGSEGSAREKMRNFMQRLCQKNQETVFKLKQEKISMIQNAKDKNKELVKNGYTQKMKRCIEKKQSLKRKFV